MEKTANVNSRSSPLVDNNRRNVISGAYFFGTVSCGLALAASVQARSRNPEVGSLFRQSLSQRKLEALR